MDQLGRRCDLKWYLWGCRETTAKNSKRVTASKIVRISGLVRVKKHNIDVHKDDQNGLYLAHINNGMASAMTQPTPIAWAILSWQRGDAWSGRIWPLWSGQNFSPGRGYFTRWALALCFAKVSTGSGGWVFDILECPYHLSHGWALRFKDDHLLRNQQLLINPRELKPLTLFSGVPNAAAMNGELKRPEKLK